MTACRSSIERTTGRLVRHNAVHSRRMLVGGIHVTGTVCTSVPEMLHLNDSATTDMELEQNPSWEVNSRSASEMSCFLWNLKVHFRVHNSPPMVSILSQMNPIQTRNTQFL
jgi:hypothetical protein